jgi:hypothetical protein
LEFRDCYLLIPLVKTILIALSLIALSHKSIEKYQSMTGQGTETDQFKTLSLTYGAG